MYSFACLVAAVAHVRGDEASVNPSQSHASPAKDASIAVSTVQEAVVPQKAVALALHELDMAAIMGGPLFRPEVDQLISAVSALHEGIETADMPPAKRQRRSSDEGTGDGPGSRQHVSGSAQVSLADEHRSSSVAAGVHPSEFASAAYAGSRNIEMQQALKPFAPQLPPGSLQSNCKLVPSEELPSLER